MKILHRPDGSLVAVSDSRRLARWFLGACLACAGLAVYRAMSESMDSERFIGSAGAAVVFLLCFLAIFEYSSFVFDRARREVIWRRHSLFSRMKGSIPFAAVESVIADTLIGSDDDITRRIALRTKSGLVPMTRAYTGDPGGELIRMAADLNAVLGRASGDEVMSSVLELINSDRETEAVRLIRAERKMSLAQAREEVSRLKQMAPGGTKPLDDKASATQEKIPQDAIDALVRGDKIDAIKIVRVANGIGLKEAKDLVERFQAGSTDAKLRVPALRSGDDSGWSGWILLVAATALLAYYFLRS